MQSLKLRSGYPAGERFVFEFPDESSARSFFNCTPKDALLTLQKWGCSEAVARYAGTETVFPLETIELMASAEPLLIKPIVQLFFADGSLPASVLKLAAEMADSDERWGIVRLSDQRQVVMSSGMSGVLLAGVGIDETTNWKRPEFWKPEHLAAFSRDWQRQLDIEGEREIEYRYQIRKPRTTEPWEWYRSLFRLLNGEDGLQYHLGIFRDRG
jgi:hypothetical protein